jgi:hypothetical protein
MAALSLCTLASFCSLFERNNFDAHGTPMDGARFKGMRTLLSARGTVGYLGDFGGEPENARAYYRTQYFLAPVVVAHDPAHDRVVANFAPGFPIARVASAHGLIVERDFANGAAILRRPSR